MVQYQWRLRPVTWTRNCRAWCCCRMAMSGSLWLWCRGMYHQGEGRTLWLCLCCWRWEFGTSAYHQCYSRRVIWIGISEEMGEKKVPVNLEMAERWCSTGVNHVDIWHFPAWYQSKVSAHPKNISFFFSFFLTWSTTAFLNWAKLLWFGRAFFFSFFFF